VGDTDRPERVGLTVPLATVGSGSPGRARLALAVWTIALATIAWIGLVGHDGEGGAPIVAAPAAAVSTPAPQTARATAPVSRGTVRYVAAPIVSHHALGEDGVMGGIVFGTNFRSSKVQADVERDGYRRYFIP
jgi:hypothetical protein